MAGLLKNSGTALHTYEKAGRNLDKMPKQHPQS
jgi:hypothetical protein